MGIPTKYRKSSAVIASYDWLDLTSGIGYRRYYACAATLSTGVVYFLTTRSDIDAFPLRITTTGTTNFDIEFGVAAYIKGDAFINLSSTWNGGTANTTKYTATIYHIDIDSNTTSLGSAITSTKSYGDWRHSLKITLAAKKFTPGEKLRLTILETTVTGNSNQQRLAIDPSSRLTFTEDSASATSNTNLTLDMPFVIDI